MPTPFTYRPQQLALAIALSLGCIEISMAQQAEPETPEAAVEATVKKPRKVSRPKKDDLSAIKNLNDPMEHAAVPVGPVPEEPAPRVTLTSGVAEPADLAANLHEPQQTPGAPPTPSKPQALEINSDFTFESFSTASDTEIFRASMRYEGVDGVALKLGDNNDLLVINKGASFGGEIQGGGGLNVIQLNSPDGGVLEKTSNFLGLQVAQGIWWLTGKDDFSLGAEVLSGATLFNMGSIAGDALVHEGGIYGGYGDVRNLQVEGTLLVNEEFGAPRIKGNLEFSEGATLFYAIKADGTSPTIIVDGVAKLENAAVAVHAVPGDYPNSSHYTVLKAGQIEGKFGPITSTLAYMTPTLSQTKTEVALKYARNNVKIEELATSESGRELGRSVTEPVSGNDKSTRANAAITALLGANRATATYALDQLAGENNANLAKATLNSDSPVSATMLSAMRQLDSAATFSNQKNAPRVAAGNQDTGRVWLQALGYGGTLDRDFDALKHSTQGLVLGADWGIDDEWRIGVMGGKSQTRLDSQTLDGNLDSWHLGAYALRQSGPMSLRLGATYSNHDGSTKRPVAFNRFSDRPKGSYDANTQQAFAEVGYNLGRTNVSIEPFASLGYQRYERGGYTEKGGDASLKVHGQTQNNLSSTFGLRLAKLNTLDNGMQLTPRFSAGWKHTFGEVTTETRQRLVTGGSNYTVSGAPLDRNSLMVDAGLDLGLSPRHTLGVGIMGEMGTDSRNHGVTGQWRMSF
jgi:outer membrane autotransporter protein